MRALRSLVIFKVGVWVGMMAAAAFVKRAVPSRGDEDSDDLSLVAVMEGVELKSRSQGFKGGSMLAWFGGIELDLSEAELAPDARLSVRTLFGGIAIDTPPDWRIESSVKTVAGGVDTQPGGFDLRQDLSNASLDLTIAVCGAKVLHNGRLKQRAFDTCFDAHVSLQWTGTGEVTSASGTDEYQAGDCTVDVASGYSRRLSLASGTISAG